jgi:hypothetical protein
MEPAACGAGLNRHRRFADYGIGGSQESRTSRAERESGMKIWPSFRALIALSLAASLLALAAPAAMLPTWRRS